MRCSIGGCPKPAATQKTGSHGPRPGDMPLRRYLHLSGTTVGVAAALRRRQHPLVSRCGSLAGVTRLIAPLGGNARRSGVLEEPLLLPTPFDQRDELLGGQPGRGSVDHPVAVRAQQDEVFRARACRAANVQRRAVMALDVVGASFAIRLLEVEPAGLAGDRGVSAFVRLDHLPAQLRVSFPA